MYNIEGLSKEQLREVIRQIDDICMVMVSSQYRDLQETNEDLFFKFRGERKRVLEELRNLKNK